MEESSGQIQDATANANHSTALVGTGHTYSQTGRVNNAIQLSAGGFSVPDSATLDLGDIFTLEAWNKRVTTLTEQVIFTKQSGAYALLWDTDVLKLQRRGFTVIVGSTITVTDTTTWHHIVATKNGATVKLYIDSVDRTGTVTNDICANNASALIIGSQPDATFPLGATMDEAAVYPTALSAARVLAHYNAASAAAPSLYVTRHPLRLGV